ncbi:phage portal protein [Lentilactobacillus kosonis]|uniref:Phage portal protein n=1 Tax=Lentilactobacillus kosonis TaxID=2810561 RepID=A0A401FPF1_9LACO|nr:phage portal protein [Lentilactobacillus kosonis]
MPLTEFKMNEERVGLWEPDLDKMDSYDLLISEMVNSQEDFNNASLLVTGKIANNASKPEVMLDSAGRPVYQNKQGGYTDQPTNEDGSYNSEVMVQRVLDTHANVIYVRPYVVDQPNGSKLVSNPTAQYLTKDFDMNGWKINIDQLMSDIHKETNTPDTSDQNFAANASGVAMSYKLFGSDQEMSFSETLYSEAVHRRMRMLASYWGIIPNSKVSLSKDVNPADNVQITFTPNLPKNNQETIQTVQGLVSTGDVSKKTIREMLSTVTGIPEDQEAQRIEEEQQQSGDDTADKVAQAIQKLHANVSPNDDSEDDSDTGGDDNGDSETSQKEDNSDGQAGQKE